MAAKPKRPTKITRSFLENIGACEEALLQFDALFPSGEAEITRANGMLAMELQLEFWIDEDSRFFDIAQEFQDLVKADFELYKLRIRTKKVEMRDGLVDSDEYDTYQKDRLRTFHHNRFWKLADLINLPDDGTEGPGSL